MKEQSTLEKQIESGEYFSDAKLWYHEKYSAPFYERSFVLIVSVIALCILTTITLNIYHIFPLVRQVKYSISADTSSNKTAQIHRADHIANDPQMSVAEIMLKNYVTHRENYDYSLLKKQVTFIKNNSTRIAYRRFFNYMNIDNPESPVLKYQKNIKKFITINSVKHINPEQSVIRFTSVAKNLGDEIFENDVWEVTIDYEIDKINPNLPSGTKFNFTVTDYNLKLIK